MALQFVAELMAFVNQHIFAPTLSLILGFQLFLVLRVAHTIKKGPFSSIIDRVSSPYKLRQDIVVAVVLCAGIYYAMSRVV